MPLLALSKHDECNDAQRIVALLTGLQTQGYVGICHLGFCMPSLTPWYHEQAELSGSFRRRSGLTPQSMRMSKGLQTMANEPYHYSPLDATNSEIRLLEVVVADPDGQIEVKLHTVSLENNPVFYALSYVWGDASNRKVIRIGSHTLSITTSLATAIQSLHALFLAWPTTLGFGHLLLWADAVCINQEDLTERASQVQLMQRIYGSTKICFAYINDDKFSIVLETMEMLREAMVECVENSADFNNLTWLERRPLLCERDNEKGPTQQQTTMSRWELLAKFFLNEYWSRVWIFQEIALSPKLIFFGPTSGEDLGPHAGVMTWRALEIVVERLTSLREHLNDNAVTRPIFVGMFVWTKLTSPQLRLVVAEQLCIIRRRKGRGGSLRFAENIAEQADIYNRTRGLHATDPKDRIYGLLGVSGLAIIPDYRPTKTIADVYCEFISSVLPAGIDGNSDTSLNFLQDAGIGLFGFQPDFPTWAPDHPNESQRELSSTRIGYQKPGSQCLFKKQEERQSYVDFKTRSLYVWGCSIDSIAVISEVPRQATLRDGRFRRLVQDAYAQRPDYTPEITMLQAFFRLFTRDGGQGNRSFVMNEEPMLLRALAFLRFVISVEHKLAADALLKGLRKFGLDLTSRTFDAQLVALFFPAVQWQTEQDANGLKKLILQGIRGPLTTAWLQTILDFIRLEKSWRYFETTNGSIGLVAEGAKIGDSVCMIKGSGPPCILRQMDGEGYYHFVCTAFIVGMMDGELSEFVNGSQADRRWFELR